LHLVVESWEKVGHFKNNNNHKSMNNIIDNGIVENICLALDITDKRELKSNLNKEIRKNLIVM
jgi:hypothetical protein